MNVFVTDPQIYKLRYNNEIFQNRYWSGEDPYYSESWTGAKEWILQPFYQLP